MPQDADASCACSYEPIGGVIPPAPPKRPEAQRTRAGEAIGARFEQYCFFLVWYSCCDHSSSMSNKTRKSADNGPASDDTTSDLESERATSSTSGSTPTQRQRRPDGTTKKEQIVKDTKEKGGMSNKSKKSAENGPAASDDSNSNLESNRPTSSSSGSTPATQPRPRPRPDRGAAEVHTVKDGEKKKKEPGTKTMWVTVFKCFHCGKHGHNLPKCRQCSQAYYCNADCQRNHWKKHNPCAQ